MDQLLIVRDFARTLMRRFFLFTVMVLIGTAASILYALSLDRVYESTAVVQIQGPQIATDLSNEASTMSTAQRIQQIEQQLRARDSLLEVAEKYDLFDAPGMTATDRVTLMREAVRLDSIAGVQQGYGRPPDPSALFITARLGDAEKAALVANEFVSQLLERNLRNREEATAETLAFFRREEERLSREIAELDTRLLEYKHENSRALPEGLEFRRDELTRLNEDSREISRRLLELAREESLLGEDGSGLRNTARVIDPVGMELSRLRIELSRMSVSSPNHPDIPRLRRQIEALEESEGADLSRRAEAQRKLLAEEADLLTDQLASITERQTELNALIQATPGVELELAGYTRQREQMQQQLDAAIQGRAETEVAQRLQSNRQSERFEVLESALVPEYPVEPSRKKIVLAGSAASMILAAGLIFLLDLLNPVIRSGSQFRRTFGVSPTIALPHVATIWENRRRRLVRWAALALVVVGVPLSLTLVDQHVMSFEEMAEAFEDLPLPSL